MPVLSIITAVYDPTPQHLLAVFTSLCDQQLPDGWQWEWIVQEDGHTGMAQAILPDDERISHGSNRHLGVAATRNLALARSTGSLIKNLDQDDILALGTLERDISVFTRHPDVEWITSPALDLLPDGTSKTVDYGQGHGKIERGLIYEYWRTHNYRLPVHPTTLCIRRELAEALGGWMAVPGSDDTGLLIAASVTTTGYHQPNVGLLYRRWAGQVSTSSEHADPQERKLRMSLIDARARALTGGLP